LRTLYAAFFFAALNFAHLARCAAAILSRAAADIILFVALKEVGATI
jgi:hypothetical protein